MTATAGHVRGLHRWTATSVAHVVRAGGVSAREVAEACLAQHANVDPGLNSLVGVDDVRVLAQADAVDARVAAGEDPGPLAGVPVAVKDNIDVADEVTTCGSRGVGMKPATDDAGAVTRLRAAGAMLMGRANMDELAMGASTQTSAFGPTYHPFDARRSPGGSSGGCAAAVASRQVPVSVGTDTGGSIREPASQCGLVGVAPSPGLVPVDGVVPFDPSCDRVGPLARTVEDARLLLEVLAGCELAPPGRRPLRLGLVRELSGPINHSGVLQLLERATRALARTPDLAAVDEVSIPDGGRALDAYMTLTSVAALPVLREHLARGGAGEEVARRRDLAELMLREGMVEPAEECRTALRRQAAAALQRCDLLVSPTMPTTAPVLRRVNADDLTDPLARPYTDCWTVVANLAGLAAVSVPAGLSLDDGMPVGLMLMGPAGSDALLLEVAGLLENSLVDTAMS